MIAADGRMHAGDPDFAPKMAEVLCVYRQVTSATAP